MRNRICRNSNIMDDAYDNEVMDAFMRQYQHLYVKAESWEEYDDDEVLIELKNGDTYLYDWLERQVYPIKLFCDVTELTEEEWRRGFAYFLEKEIDRSDFTQYELAESMGITNAMMSRYVNGRATPSCYRVQRIADTLGRDVRDLLPHDFIPLR